MEIDELIDKLVSDEGTPAPHQTGTKVPDKSQDVVGVNTTAAKREKLASVIAGGRAERYLGRTISLDQIDKLTNSEVEKLYARYEAALGASMASTLGRAILTMYSNFASHCLPIDNTNGLSADLESDPFLEHGLSSITCSLFYRYGLLLAPIALISNTVKHIKWGAMQAELSEHGADIGAEKAEKPEES